MQTFALDVPAVPRRAGVVRIEELCLRPCGGYVLVENVRRRDVALHDLDHVGELRVVPLCLFLRIRRSGREHRQRSSPRDFHPVSVAELEKVVVRFRLVGDVVPLVIVAVQQPVEQLRQNAERRRLDRKRRPRLEALPVGNVPDKLVRALHGRIEKRHKVLVQHLCHRAASGKVRCDVRRAEHRLHEVALRELSGFHSVRRLAPALVGKDGHKLRKTWRRFDGLSKALIPCRSFAQRVLRLLHHAGRIVQHGGIGSAQRLVLLPDLAVCHDLLPRRREHFRPCCRVRRVERRVLRVSHKISHHEDRVISGTKRLEQVVALLQQLRNVGIGVFVRLKCIHRLRQPLVHRDVVPVIPAQNGKHIVCDRHIQLFAVHILIGRGIVHHLHLVHARNAFVLVPRLHKLLTELVETGVFHHRHRLSAHRRVQRHDDGVSAHGPSDGVRYDDAAVSPRPPCRLSLCALHAHRRHIVRVSLLHRVHMLLCVESGVDAVLQKIVEIGIHPLCESVKLRVGFQQPFGFQLAIVGRDLVSEHRFQPVLFRLADFLPREDEHLRRLGYVRDLRHLAAEKLIEHRLFPFSRKHIPLVSRNGGLE